MLNFTFHQETAICNIASSRFTSKTGKLCVCSELFFIDGTSMKHYDFGRLASAYQVFCAKYRPKPFVSMVMENTKKEDDVNGTDE